jgi:hypothetical protein
MTHTTFPDDGTVREWYELDMRQIVHHKAVYIEFRTWNEMFPHSTGPTGVPFDHEWAMYRESDYWMNVQYPDGVHREHHHGWTMTGRSARDPREWFADQRNQRVYFDFDEAKRIHDEHMHSSIAAAEQTIRECRAQLAQTKHECASFPIAVSQKLDR